MGSAARREYDRRRLGHDEATATYFESLMNSGTLDAIDTMGNWKRIYDGIFPPSDTAEHGYARMPLIEFLAGSRRSRPRERSTGV